MARLAQEWAENSFSLPRKIEVLERDMANGYIFLNMFNQAELVNEDDLEMVTDSMDPEDILKNFRIMDRALRQINITLTKKRVAEIVSEQPGASAALIMDLKKGLKMKGKHISNIPKYKLALKTMRPNENYQRASTKYRNLSNDGKFVADAFETIPLGNFNLLDQKCQEDAYFTFTHAVEEKMIAKDELETANRQMELSLRITDDIQKLRTVKANRENKEELLKTNWKKTQKVKRDRQIRDLHFENAVYAIKELRTLRANQVCNNEQMNGIDQFEQILRRAGISGGDDDMAELTTTYEEGEAFIKRLEDTAQKKWPSNESVNDFLIHLKETTQGNRQARHEKAIRKRKMLVEQNEAAEENARKAEEEELRELHFAKEKEEAVREQAEREKQLMKTTRMEEVSRKNAELTAKMNEDAEQFLRIFSEQQRMIAAENDRENDLLEVQKAQKARAEQKHIQSVAMCHSLVMDLVNNDPTFGCAVEIEQVKSVKEQFHGLNVDADFLYSDALLNTLKADLSALKADHPASYSKNSSANALQSISGHVQRFDAVSVPRLCIHDIVSDDVWTMNSSIVKNMLKWNSGASDTSSVGGDVCTRVNSFSEECRIIFTTLLHRLINLEKLNKIRDEKASGLVQEDSGLMEQMTSLNCSFSELKSLHKIVELEDEGNNVIETCSSGSDTDSETNKELQQANLVKAINKLNSENRRVILVMGDTASGKFSDDYGVITEQQWKCISDCLGNGSSVEQDHVSFWDISDAIEAGKKLHSIVVEGKQQLSFSILVSVFSKSHQLVQCPQEMDGTVLTAQSHRIATEIMEYCGKMYSMVKDVSASGANDMTLSAFNFSDVSLCIVLSHAIWLRCYIQDVWCALEKSGCTAVKCPLPGMIIAGKLFTQTAALSNSMDIRIVQWFLGGGTKDSVIDDSDLDLALQNEGPPKKSPAPDGSAIPSKASKQSSTVAHHSDDGIASRISTAVDIHGVLWMKSESCIVTEQDKLRCAQAKVEEEEAAAAALAAAGGKAAKAPIAAALSGREFIDTLLKKFARAVDVKRASDEKSEESSGDCNCTAHAMFPISFSSVWRQPVPVFCVNILTTPPFMRKPVAIALFDAGSTEMNAAAEDPLVSSNTVPWLCINIHNPLAIVHTIVSCTLGIANLINSGEIYTELSAFTSPSPHSSVHSSKHVSPSISPRRVAATDGQVHNGHRAGADEVESTKVDSATVMAAVTRLWKDKCFDVVCSIARGRIESLPPLEKLWMLHLLDMNTLTSSIVVDCLDILESTACKQLEWYTVLWTSVNSKIHNINHVIHEISNQLVCEVKKPEEGFRTVCSNFLNVMETKLPGIGMPQGSMKSNTTARKVKPSKSGSIKSAGISSTSTLPARHNGLVLPIPPATVALTMTTKGNIIDNSAPGQLTQLTDQIKCVEMGVSELTCAVGSMIDAKHKRCFELAGYLHEKIRALLNTICCHIESVVFPLFVECTDYILQEKFKFASALVSKFQECGFSMAESAPLPVPLVALSASDKSSTTMSTIVDGKISQLKEIISKVHQLFSNITVSVEGEVAGDGKKSAGVERETRQSSRKSTAVRTGTVSSTASHHSLPHTPWSPGKGLAVVQDVVQVETEDLQFDAPPSEHLVWLSVFYAKLPPEPCCSALRNIYQELYVEVVNVAQGFLAGCLTNVELYDRFTNLSLKQDFEIAIRRNNKYQHSMLTKWASDVKNAFGMDVQTGRVNMNQLTSNQVQANGQLNTKNLSNSITGGGLGISILAKNASQRSLNSCNGSSQLWDQNLNSSHENLWYQKGISLLSKYYFSVSTSKLDDGVAWVSPQGCIDIENYLLTPALLLSMSNEMNVVINKYINGENGGAGTASTGKLTRANSLASLTPVVSTANMNRIDVAAVPAFLLESLLGVVQMLIDKGFEIPSAWRDTRRVDELVHSFPVDSLYRSEKPDEQTNSDVEDIPETSESVANAEEFVGTEANENEEAKSSASSAVGSTGEAELAKCTDDVLLDEKIKPTTASTSQVIQTVSSSMVLKAFFKKLMMTLVLGIVPISPSVDYICNVVRAAVCDATLTDMEDYQPFYIDFKGVPPDTTNCKASEITVPVIDPNDIQDSNDTENGSDEVDVEAEIPSIHVPTREELYEEQFVSSMVGNLTVSELKKKLSKSETVKCGWWKATELPDVGTTSMSTINNYSMGSKQSYSATGIRGKETMGSGGAKHYLVPREISGLNVNTIPVSPSNDSITLLQALALLCLDIKQKIVLDDFIMLLCSSVCANGYVKNNVLSEAVNEDEMFGVVHSDGSVRATPCGLNSVFSNKSLYMLGFLAKRLISPDFENENQDVVLDRGTTVEDNNRTDENGAIIEEKITTVVDVDDVLLKKEFCVSNGIALTRKQFQWFYFMLNKFEMYNSCIVDGKCEHSLDEIEAIFNSNVTNTSISKRVVTITTDTSVRTPISPEVEVEEVESMGENVVSPRPEQSPRPNETPKSSPPHDKNTTGLPTTGSSPDKKSPGIENEEKIPSENTEKGVVEYETTNTSVVSKSTSFEVTDRKVIFLSDLPTGYDEKNVSFIGAFKKYNHMQLQHKILKEE